MSTSIDYLPLPGLSVTAYNQAGPAAVGHQKDATFQLAEVTIGTSPMNPVTVTQVASPCTYPAVVLNAAIVGENVDASSYDFVVPFPCKLVDAFYLNAGAAASGDKFALKQKLLSGTTNVIVGDTQVNTGTGAITRIGGLDATYATFKAGDAIELFLTSDTNIAGTCFVTLVPVA